MYVNLNSTINIHLFSFMQATLTANGQLTPKYTYITQLREQRRCRKRSNLDILIIFLLD